MARLGVIAKWDPSNPQYVAASKWRELTASQKILVVMGKRSFPHPCRCQSLAGTHRAHACAFHRETITKLTGVSWTSTGDLDSNSWIEKYTGLSAQEITELSDQFENAAKLHYETKFAHRKETAVLMTEVTYQSHYAQVMAKSAREAQMEASRALLLTKIRGGVPPLSNDPMIVEGVKVVDELGRMRKYLKPTAR